MSYAERADRFDADLAAAAAADDSDSQLIALLGRPQADDRERINRIIFEELVYGRFEQPARGFFQDVITKLKARGCDAVALSCTEIPLLIGEGDACLPILDSTRILARAALREARR